MRIGEEANFNVEITPQAPIGVVIGDNAKMDVQKAITYVESGKKEIEKAVEDGKADFDDHAADKTQDFDDNAVNKTNAFNQNAVNKTQAFDDNAAIKQAAVDASAAEAKQWAIGDPSEPDGYSSKYWAGQAHDELSDLQSDVAAIQANYVTTNTVQTINGTKNINSSSLRLYASDLTKGTVPDTTKWKELFVLNDSTKQSVSWQNSRLGIMQMQVDATSGNTTLSISCYRNAVNSTSTSSLLLKYDNVNNKASASITSSPATSDNSTNIATTAYVKNNLVNYVTTDTAQTISGSKTFSGNFVNSNNTERTLVLKNTTADALTAPESTLYTGTISTRDKNDKAVTNIRSALLTNGSQLSYYVRNYSEGSKHIQSWFSATTYSDGSGAVTFSVSNNGSGDTRTATNRCLSSSTSSTTETRLACQGWVNNSSTATNVVHRSGTETITGNKNFTGDLTAVTQSNSDNSTKVATTAYVENKFQVVASLPATPDADTFYFIQE